MSIVETMQAFASMSSHRLRASTASISVGVVEREQGLGRLEHAQRRFEVLGRQPCNRWLEGRPF